MKKFKWKYEDLHRSLLIFGLFVLVASLAIYVWLHLDLILRFVRSEFDVREMLRHLRAKSPLNFTILLGLTSITAAIPFMSNAVFTIFNGVVYGPVLGFAMNLTGNVLGNVLFTDLVKHIDLGDHEAKIQGRLSHLPQFKSRGLTLTLYYMLPIVPTILVNYVIAETRQPLLTWLPYVALGVAPTSLIYALGGDAIVNGNLKRLAWLAALLILVVLIVSLLKRKKESH